MTSEPAIAAGTGDSLTIRRHGELLRGGVRVIVLSIAVAVIAAIAVSLALPRTWKSSATLYVGQSLTEPSFDYGGLLASQLLTPTYARLATSTDLLEAVATELGLDERPEQLAQRIETDAPTGGSLAKSRLVDWSVGGDESVVDPVEFPASLDAVCLGPALVLRLQNAASKVT